MIECLRGDCRTAGALCALVLLASCDCMRVVNALVLDEETGRPIAGARVRERHGNGHYEDEYLVTENSGRFEFKDISGGFRRCPPVQLHISKDGYVPKDREFEAGSGGDTVFLRAETWRYKAP